MFQRGTTVHSPQAPYTHMYDLPQGLHSHVKQPMTLWLNAQMSGQTANGSGCRNFDLHARGLPVVGDLQLDVVLVGSLEGVDKGRFANGTLQGGPLNCPAPVPDQFLIQVSGLALRALVGH
jgi:hypothetical protein